MNMYLYCFPWSSHTCLFCPVRYPRAHQKVRWNYVRIFWILVVHENFGCSFFQDMSNSDDHIHYVSFSSEYSLIGQLTKLRDKNMLFSSEISRNVLMKIAYSVHVFNWLKIIFVGIFWRNLDEIWFRVWKHEKYVSVDIFVEDFINWKNWTTVNSQTFFFFVINIYKLILIL